MIINSGLLLPVNNPSLGFLGIEEKKKKLLIPKKVREEQRQEINFRRGLKRLEQKGWKI